MSKLDNPQKKTKPFRFLYRFYCFSAVLLWVLLAYAILEASSFEKRFLLIWLEENWMAPFVTADSIQNVAETIGFGSILLVWIYAVLDKQELGLRYSCLLRAVYPAFHRFVIAHLVAILLCVGLSTAGIADVALVALMIVLLGGFIHCKAMFLLIFYSKDRRRAAADLWEKWLMENQVDQSYLNKLCNVTHVLGLENDPAAMRIRSYFYHGLVRYAMSIDNYPSAEEEAVQSVLSDLTLVWDLLLRPRANSERLILAGDVLGMANGQPPEGTQTMRPECLGAVCSAYVICVYRLCQEENIVPDEEEVIRHTNQQLKLTSLRCNSPEAVSHLLLSKQLLAWMSLYTYNIPFDTSLFIETGKYECLGDREILYAMICLMLQERIPRDTFDMICSQLFSYNYQSTDGEEEEHDSTSHPAETDRPAECGVLSGCGKPQYAK